MNQDNFIYQIKNFEKIFAKNIISTSDNSAEPFFAKAAKEFIEKLREEIDFSEYKNLDIVKSFIEVDEEGQTRIYLQHEEDLPLLPANGIEIFIANEIYISWFALTHSHYYIGDDFSHFSKKDNNEVKWDYSEIDEAIRDIKDSLDFPTKMIEISWGKKRIASGFWSRKTKEFRLVRWVRPIVFLQKLFFFWMRKKEEKVFYVDWKKEIKNAKKVTKDDILQKLENFLKGKISRKELAEWARHIKKLYQEHKLIYDAPQLEDAIYAISFADANINNLAKQQKKALKNSLAEGILISFEEYSDALSEKEIEKMINWLKEIKE